MLLLLTICALVAVTSSVVVAQAARMQDKETIVIPNELQVNRLNSPTSQRTVQPGHDTEEETIAKCLDDLKSQDVAHRRRAAMLIGKYDTPAATEAVIRCLMDTDAQVRQSALVSLSEQNYLPSEARMYVFRLLEDENVHIRRLASSMLPEALGGAYSRFSNVNPSVQVHARGNRTDVENEQVLTAMNKALYDSDPSVRRNVLAAARYFPVPLSQKGLERFLRDDDKEVRSLALLAYTRTIGHEAERAAAIMHLVDDPVPQVRTILVTTAASLGEYGAPILKKLFADTDSNVRFEALNKYTLQFQPDSYSVLKAAILDDTLPMAQRAKLCSNLRYFRQQAAEFAKSLLDSPHNAIRAAVLPLFSSNAFGELPIDYFLSLADEKNEEIRSQALRILQARLRNPPPAKATIEKLFASRHANVRLLAVNLMSLPTVQRSCVDLIQDAVLDDDAAIRKAAIRLLATVRPLGWEELIAASLEDEDLDIREAAATAVCQPPLVFHAKIIEPLKKALPSLKNQLTINRVNNYLRQYERTGGQGNRRAPIPPRPLRPLPNRARPVPAP